MSHNSLKEVVLKNKNLNFLIFIKNVLAWEKNRIDKNFVKDSYFEDISSKFGIFPKVKLYPMYFYGNIEMPKNKYVSIGINPSYTGRIEEEEYRDQKNSITNYYNFLKNAFLKWKEDKYYNNKFFPYLNKISLYLSKKYNINRDDINYDWLQNNVVNLEFLPYHSKSADGLKINNIEDYFETNFVILEKFVKYLNPQKEIVIFGFPKIIELLELNRNNKIKFKKKCNVYKGKMFGYKFIGLNFRFSRNDIE